MSFEAAKLNSGSIPRHRELPLASGAAGEDGALLVRDGDGNWAECGADPAVVGGVANSGFGADTSGFAALGRKEFPTGYMVGTLVVDEQPFTAQYVGSLPAADGGSYGVVRDTDGKWKVDFSDTTNLVVKLVGRRTGETPAVARVVVTFLPAVVQVIA